MRENRRRGNKEKEGIEGMRKKEGGKGMAKKREARE